MNDILTEEAKSFKLIRPKMKNGQHKPLITYTKKLMDTLYIGLSRTQEGLLTGLKYPFSSQFLYIFSSCSLKLNLLSINIPLSIIY